jgi:diguanylate cyclase (GGDEF)-like protein
MRQDVADVSTGRAGSLRGLPHRAAGLLLAVDVAAITLLATAVAHDDLDRSDIGRFVLLFGLSTVYSVAAGRVERIARMFRAGTIWTNQQSIWIAAGIVVLPGALVGLLVVALYARSLVRAVRDASGRPHRIVFSAAAAVLAAMAAHAVFQWSSGPSSAQPITALAAVAAALTFTLLSLGIVVTGRRLAESTIPWSAVLPRRSQLTDEATALTLGLMLAGVVLGLPWLSPAVLILVAAVHRSSLAPGLQEAACTDAKTGLLTLNAWRDQVSRAISGLERRNATAAVLMIDLDHFKAINDTYGHLAGDRVLKAAAGSLRRELRTYDAVGRFGGEEFLVFLSDTGRAGAQIIADRLRRRVRELHEGDPDLYPLTASIGIAVYPDHAGDLDSLIAAADRAVFSAKQAGRDASVMA